MSIVDDLVENLVERNAVKLNGELTVALVDGGLPTAEVFAGAYLAMGCPVYSSAVFNFIPRTAIEFYKAHAAGDTATTNRLIETFFLPYIELRNRGQGYAASFTVGMRPGEPASRRGRWRL